MASSDGGLGAARMKPYAGIVRVSHMGARKSGSDDFHADEDQVREIERYCDRLGVPVEILPAELAVSGGKPIEDRPSLKAAIEGVERGAYAGIVVAYLSRLTRSRSGLEIWDRVEAAGGHVHSAQENLDTSTPSGRFVRDIHLANAVREREEHVERFESRREGATAAGIWQRRQTPLGYDRDPETRRLVPNGDATKVREAFRAAPSTARVELARRLGLTTSGVRHLLRNRVYLGELRVGKHVNREAHPAIVTEEEWLAAQNGGGTRPPRRHDAPALLAGLVRCASCGYVMSRSRGGYTCVNRDRDCPRRAAIREARLDAYVSEIALAELRKIRLSARDAHQDASDARDALAAARRELTAFLEGVEAAGLDPDDYAAGLRQRKANVTAAERRLTQLLARRPAETERDALEVFKRGDSRQRNHILRGLLEGVVIWPCGRGRSVPPPERVRILAVGAGVFERYRGAGKPMSRRTFALEDFSGPYVLGP